MLVSVQKDIFRDLYGKPATEKVHPYASNKKFPYHDTASGPRKYTHTLVTLDSEHQSRVLRKPEGKVVCTIFGSTTIQQDIGTAVYCLLNRYLAATSPVHGYWLSPCSLLAPVTCWLSCC